MTSWCDEPGRDSILCRIADTYDLHLETVGEIVAAVNLRALKEGLYEKDDATQVLRFLKDVARDGMDVGDFGEEVSSLLNDVPEFMIVRPYLSILTIQQSKVLRPDDVAALGWYFDREIARVVRQKIQLEPGMIFCTRNPMWLGRAINTVQKIWSQDNQSQYSHAGVIIDSMGGTFESLSTIRKGGLSDYAGKEILIGRHPVAVECFQAGWDAVKAHEGQWYPFHRLIFHLLPPLAKYVSTGRFPVCSELTAKFLSGCGVSVYWKGKNPDHIADMIHRWKDFYVVWEGG